MAKPDIFNRLGRDEAAVPTAETVAPVTPPEWPKRAEAGEAVEEEALSVDMPLALKRELKMTAAIRGEKMKHVVARAIRRELNLMDEDYQTERYAAYLKSQDERRQIAYNGWLENYGEKFDAAHAQWQEEWNARIRQEFDALND